MDFSVASSIDSATVGAIAKAIDPAFSAMATLTGKAVELAIRQNYVYAVQDMIVAISSIIVGTISAILLRRILKKEDFYWGDVDDGPWAFIFIVFIVACSITAITESCYIASRLINPEYMAIKDVIFMIKGQ